MPLRQRVISAFPATGKSHVAKRDSRYVDSDSSTFSRDDDWPANYIGHIRDMMEVGARVMVSSHVEVRQALVAARIPFTLVYPDEGCRYEYQGRMMDRGSDPKLIQAVFDNWREWISGCRLQQGCDHYVLTSGEYLLDALTDIELRDVA